jgi:hypothetical protein
MTVRFDDDTKGGIMREEDIDDCIRQHFASVNLSEARMERILAGTPGRSVETGHGVVPFYRRVWFSYAAAACIAFMIVSVVLIQATRMYDRGSPVEIASQVIGLHAMHLQPDVYSADLRSIQAGLNHSDFSIIPTNMEPLGNYLVTGGRNCGMKGLKAVHVVLVNKHSMKESCLYILPDVQEFQRFRDEWVSVGSHKVSFWHDNGRFFALYDPSGN